jgi:hypothetical protein
MTAYAESFQCLLQQDARRLRTYPSLTLMPRIAEFAGSFVAEERAPSLSSSIARSLSASAIPPALPARCR